MQWDSLKSGEKKLYDTMSQSSEGVYMGLEAIKVEKRKTVLPPIRAEPYRCSKQPTAQS